MSLIKSVGARPTSINAVSATDSGMSSCIIYTCQKFLPATCVFINFLKNFNHNVDFIFISEKASQLVNDTRKRLSKIFKIVSGRLCRIHIPSI